MPASGVQTREAPALLPVALSGKGFLNIDSIPSKVAGELRIGDNVEKIQTPLVRTNLDLTEDLQMEIILNKEGYHPLREKVVLSSAEPAFVKSYPLQAIVSSQINVQAKPWGMVTIPGIAVDKETPLTGVSVKPGGYALKVHYPPRNQWVESVIQVGEGQRVLCLADFTLIPPAIRCRH